jgi:hypothetical protein
LDFSSILSSQPVSMSRGHAMTHRSPEHFRTQTHSSLTYRSFRVPSLLLPVRCLSRSNLPTTGLASHRDLIGSVHSRGGFQSPAHVPSSGFLNLSTVYSALQFHRLISSWCHVQSSLRPGVSRFAQHFFLTENNAPMPLAHRSLDNRSRLHHTAGLNFEALLHTK